MTWYLETEHPIAVNSLDHTDPRISIVDNSHNVAFNAKLYQLCPPPISVFDVGCGGGAFVKTILDDGNDAVGIDGTDSYIKIGAPAWLSIPEHLFTCDATHPFMLHKGDHISHQFDVVTAWEFVEHIEEQDLPQVWENIYNHLKSDGLFILTTPNKIYNPPKRRPDHHRTRKRFDWWEENIIRAGFQHVTELEDYFEQDWVRLGGLHLVFKKIDYD